MFHAPVYFSFFIFRAKQHNPFPPPILFFCTFFYYIFIFILINSTQSSRRGRAGKGWRCSGTLPAEIFFCYDRNVRDTCEAVYMTATPTDTDTFRDTDTSTNTDTATTHVQIPIQLYWDMGTAKFTDTFRQAILILQHFHDFHFEWPKYLPKRLFYCKLWPRLKICQQMCEPIGHTHTHAHYSQYANCICICICICICLLDFFACVDDDFWSFSCAAGAFNKFIYILELPIQ